MRNHAPDVFGLGQCAWDYIAEIDDYPPPDTKYEINALVLEGGGPVATALVALSRWGYSCHFSGVIGDDDIGREIISSLQQAHIDTSGVMIRPDSVSQSAFITAEPRNGRRTIFSHRPTGKAVQADEIDTDKLLRSKALHIDGIFPEASKAAAQLARKNGIPVIFDAGTLREGRVALAQYTDYFFVSEQFAREYIGEDNPRKACMVLQKLGPHSVGVTLGARGYVARQGDKWFEGPAYPVQSVDTTGCGDIFHAGLTYGVLQKWEMAKILRFSAWAAAMVATKIGGRAGIPAANLYPDKET